MLKRLAISIIVAIVAIGITIGIRFPYMEHDLRHFCFVLSDGCFLAAVILILAGLIGFFINNGMFSGGSYAFKRLRTKMTKPKDSVEAIEEANNSYYEFLKAQEKDKDKQLKVKEILIVGLVCLFLAILFAFFS